MVEEKSEVKGWFANNPGKSYGPVLALAGWGLLGVSLAGNYYLSKQVSKSEITLVAKLDGDEGTLLEERVSCLEKSNDCYSRLISCQENLSVFYGGIVQNGDGTLNYQESP